MLDHHAGPHALINFFVRFSKHC